jgi:large subunit ribosomal protein L9
VFEKKAAQDFTDAEGRAVALKDYKLTIAAKAGSEGKLFGSIGTGDIAEAMTAAGYPVVRAEVRMPNGPIRVVGEQTLALHLHTDVNVDIIVAVVAEA